MHQYILITEIQSNFLFIYIFIQQPKRLITILVITMNLRKETSEMKSSLTMALLIQKIQEAVAEFCMLTHDKMLLCLII
jgi:hypothetical protein